MGTITRPGNTSAPPPRFIEGRTEEVQELFGIPLPTFPESPEPAGDEPAFLVQLHPGLQPAFLSFLDATARSVMETAGKTREFQQTEWAYFQLLLQVATNAVRNERRSGLLNLLWVAHSKEIAATVREYFDRGGIPTHIKYQIHPHRDCAFGNGNSG